MDDDIKQESTNRYSSRLRNSLPHINYAEDYSDFNYNSESSEDGIYSRRLSLSRNRKRRKIYNGKDSLMYLNLNRNGTNYENDEMPNNDNESDNDNDNRLNGNQSIQDIEDDNDTVNENEIENVDEIGNNNIQENKDIGINGQDDVKKIKKEIEQDDINLIKRNNNEVNGISKSYESNSTESNHYNTRYNTRSHYKKIIIKNSSTETTEESQNIPENVERNNSVEVRHKNQSGNAENVNTKVIEDDLENSFDIHRRGRPRKKIIIEEHEPEEENNNSHYNLRNRTNSSVSKRKTYDEEYEEPNNRINVNENGNEKDDNYNPRYSTRYATRYQTRYATRYSKLHSVENEEEEEEEEPPQKMYLRKRSLELKKLSEHTDEILESRKVGNYNLRRSDQTINYSLPNLIDNAHKHMEKGSRNQRHRIFMNRTSTNSYTYRKKRSYSYRDKSDSEDERKNLFIGRAPRRIGLGGNGLRGNGRGDDDDNGRSIVPLNIKELLLAEQKVLQQMHLSSNPNDSEMLKNMLTHDGQNIADTDQVDVKPIDFSMVGGLDEHIQSLKEMVILPLLYPEVYSKFAITPPRGVLFHGPPGTGKTLLARALASSCSTQNQKVAFFMRKGADCLTKWVGESERQLKLLFEEAKVWQPSIIFFDEIDGLAPVRSSKQDQIHSSIVTTLLSLMDGLDKRGQVVVIGATNRIDSIDPALRRPGRFDREFYFPLPNTEARKKIIEINTKSWKPPLEPKVVNQLANITKGYCGADVKALCTEAAIHAMKKTYPQIYDSADKLLINTDDIVVHISDFLSALKSIKPSTFRSLTGNSREIPKDLMPLFRTNYLNIIDILDNIIPIITKERKYDWARNDGSDYKSSLDDNEYNNVNDSLEHFDSRLLSWSSLTTLELKSYQMYRLRLLICGEKGMGQTNYIGPAIVNKLENWGFFVKSFDLNTLLKESYQTIESTIILSFQELSRHSPVAIYIPNIDLWWNSVSDVIKNIFLMNLEDFESKYPVFFLATCNRTVKEIPEILKLFNVIPHMSPYNIGLKRVYEVIRPNMNEIKEFFKNIIDEIKKEPPVNYIPIKSKITNNIIGLEPPKKEETKETIKKVLPKAPPPPPREFTKEELDKIHEHDEYVLAELRRELRTMTKELRKDKELKVFCYPVDLSEAEDYLECIEHPMDFSKIDEKIDNREYNTPKEWYDDIELIVNNAMTYNQNYDPNNIIRKAKILKDSVKVMMHFLNPELVWECNQVIRHRKLEEIQNKKNNKGHDNNNNHNNNGGHNNNNNNNSNNHHNNTKNQVDDNVVEVNKYHYHAGAPGTRQSRRLLGQKPDLDIVSFENLTNLKKNRHNNNNNNNSNINDNNNNNTNDDNNNNNNNEKENATNVDKNNDNNNNNNENIDKNMDDNVVNENLNNENANNENTNNENTNNDDVNNENVNNENVNNKNVNNENINNENTNENDKETVTYETMNNDNKNENGNIIENNLQNNNDNDLNNMNNNNNHDNITIHTVSLNANENHTENQTIPENNSGDAIVENPMVEEKLKEENKNSTMINNESYPMDMDESNESNTLNIRLTSSPETQSQFINDDTIIVESPDHEEKPIEEEIMKPVFELDEDKLIEFEDHIVAVSRNLTIEMIQFLSSELTHLIMIKRNEWNRNEVIEDAINIVNQFNQIHY